MSHPEKLHKLYTINFFRLRIRCTWSSLWYHGKRMCQWGVQMKKKNISTCWPVFETKAIAANLRPPYPVNKATVPPIQCCFIATCVCINTNTYSNETAWYGRELICLIALSLMGYGGLKIDFHFQSINLSGECIYTLLLKKVYTLFPSEYSKCSWSLTPSSFEGQPIRVP